MEVNEILVFLTDTDNKLVIWPLFILALGRVLLEICGMNFDRYPVTKKLERKFAFFCGKSFHKTGFYLSIGYILLFIPALI